MGRHEIHSLFVLDRLVELFQRHPNLGPTFFRDTIFLCLQPSLQTQVCLFQAFQRLGARIGENASPHVFSLGSIYSESPEGRARLQSLLGPHYFEHDRNLKRLQVEPFSGILSERMRDMCQSFIAYLIDLEQSGVHQIQQIIVLDEGAQLISCMISLGMMDKEGYLRDPKGLLQGKYRMAGIEQMIQEFEAVTTRDAAGEIIRRVGKCGIPVVHVSTSSDKTLFEQALMTQATIKSLYLRFPSLGEDAGFSIGVVGMGPIGRAIVETMHQQGHQVFIYDTHPIVREAARIQNQSGVTVCDSMTDLMVRSDGFIFGVSGEDVTQSEIKTLQETLNTLKGRRRFVSVSSGDEFRALLSLCVQQGQSEQMTFFSDPIEHVEDVLPDISFQVGTCHVFFARLGCPIYYSPPDYLVEGEPSQMQFRMGWLLGAAVQAKLLSQQMKTGAPSKISLHPLSPKVQDCCMNFWLEDPENRFKDSSLFKTFYPWYRDIDGFYGELFLERDPLAAAGTAESSQARSVGDDPLMELYPQVPVTLVESPSMITLAFFKIRLLMKSPGISGNSPEMTEAIRELFRLEEQQPVDSVWFYRECVPLLMEDLDRWSRQLDYVALSKDLMDLIRVKAREALDLPEIASLFLTFVRILEKWVRQDPILVIPSLIEFLLFLKLEGVPPQFLRDAVDRGESTKIPSLFREGEFTDYPLPVFLKYLEHPDWAIRVVVLKLLQLFPGGGELMDRYWSVMMSDPNVEVRAQAAQTYFVFLAGIPQSDPGRVWSNMGFGFGRFPGVVSDVNGQLRQIAEGRVVCSVTILLSLAQSYQVVFRDLCTIFQFLRLGVKPKAVVDCRAGCPEGKVILESEIEYSEQQVRSLWAHFPYPGLWKKVVGIYLKTQGDFYSHGAGYARKRFMEEPAVIHGLLGAFLFNQDEKLPHALEHYHSLVCYIDSSLLPWLARKHYSVSEKAFKALLAQAYRDLGWGHYILNRREEAEQHFLSAIQYEPTSAEGYVSYAYFLCRSRRCTEAMVCLEEMFALKSQAGSLVYGPRDKPLLEDFMRSEIDWVHGEVAIPVEWLGIYLLIDCRKQEGIQDFPEPWVQRLRASVEVADTALGYRFLGAVYGILQKKYEVVTCFSKAMCCQTTVRSKIPETPLEQRERFDQILRTELVSEEAPSTSETRSSALQQGSLFAVMSDTPSSSSSSSSQASHDKEGPHAPCFPM